MTNTNKLRRIVRQAHRWIGLLIAVQLVLWVFGGLVMSVLRLEEVKGEDRIAKDRMRDIARLRLIRVLPGVGG